MDVGPPVRLVPYTTEPWSEITPGLFVGCHVHNDYATRELRRTVVRDEFDLVVSLSGWPGPGGPADGVEHLRYLIPDAPLTTTDFTHLGRLAGVIVAAIEDGRSVLVRCEAGLNRSALLAGLALIRMGWTADNAIAALRERRSPNALCNELFVGYLQEAERVWRARAVEVAG